MNNKNINQCLKKINNFIKYNHKEYKTSKLLLRSIHSALISIPFPWDYKKYVDVVYNKKGYTLLIEDKYKISYEKFISNYEDLHKKKYKLDKKYKNKKGKRDGNETIRRRK